MTKRLCTATDAVLVAIDMSKHRQEVLIERPEGGRCRRMTVLAMKPDYDRLVEDLAAIGRPILVGFEATGNYHRTLAHRLLTAGFKLRMISSVVLARTREAMTALPAKMARVAHAVVKTQTEYRPFLERSGTRWKDPSLQVP